MKLNWQYLKYWLMNYSNLLHPDKNLRKTGTKTNFKKGRGQYDKIKCF